LANSKTLYKWLLASLIFTYSLIFVGGLVRVSGSGMGCPDWPTCFGKLIPPTGIDQISWFPQAEFEMGDMILHNDTLWVSDFNFTALRTFGSENWHPYEKHNYAEFNVMHTWIEYFNRLFGITTGLVITIAMIFSLMLCKQFPRLAWVTVGAFLLTGFEGWLGAKVVDSHLSPMIITLHMLFALIIVSLLIYALLLLKLSSESDPGISYNNKTPLYLKILWGVTVIEILLGTHMREGLENLIIIFPDSTVDFLMTTLGTFKYIHTALGILLISITAILWNKIIIHSNPSRSVVVLMRLLIGLFIFQVGMGELMVFGKFSPSFRLLHMWGASLSIGVIMAIFMYIEHVEKDRNVNIF
jgi:cytochrome c oxidase assembly protein subunit 15